MSYIGKEPADSFISFAKQDFSTSATTSYTLDNAVTNENELALFINFVRQEPTTAYTASGTTLTLQSATASGDDMYCVYLGQAKQTVNAPDGSVGNSQIASTIITGQTAETSIATDDTVLIHDTSAGALRKMTRANFVSGIGGLDTIFNLSKNGDQASISDGTLTKITGWTANVDTGSGWDNSNNKFVIPSGKAGKYLIGATISQTQSGGGNSGRDTYDIMIFKDGAVAFTNHDKTRPGADFCSNHITAILDLDAADYLEIYVKVTAGGGSTTVLEHSGYQTSNDCTNWFGCKLA